MGCSPGRAGPIRPGPARLCCGVEQHPTRRLSRLGLIVWLLLPLVIVGLLWFSVDRSQGRPDPERWRRVPAGPGIGEGDAGVGLPDSPDR